MANCREVTAVVFDVQLGSGPVDVIGVPFDLSGETFAVHRPVDVGTSTKFCVVSHVKSGYALPRVCAPTIDAAREGAIKVLEEKGADEFAKVIRQLRRQAKTLALLEA
jgi:hypothetical protein